MRRSEFITYLSILPLVGILGCSSPTATNKTDEFMGKVEGKSSATAKVSYKVVDKDGNLKEEGTKEMKIEPKKE